MQKRILLTLFGVLFIVMVGFSVLFPVEPFYIQRFGANAQTMGWLIGIYSLMQFFFSPLWGRMSDRVGRKPVMIIGLIGFAASMALFGSAQSVPMLFVARGLAGILSSAALPTAMAAVADTTSQADRAHGMGVLGAAFGLGVIFGPIIGGTLAVWDISLPFFVTAGLAALTAGAVYLFLPEPLRHRHPDSMPAYHGTPHSSRWSALTKETGSLYVLAFVVTLSLAGLEVAFPFLADEKLGLDVRRVGYVYAVMGLVSAGVQGGLVGRLKRRLGEERMIIIGLAVSVVGLGGVTYAPTPGWATVALSLFGAGHGLIRPSNASLISQRATGGYGLAIGLLDSMDSLGRVVGPIVGAQLFSLAYGLPFMAGAALNGIALIGFTWVFLRSRRGPASTRTG